MNLKLYLYNRGYSLSLIRAIFTACVGMSLCIPTKP
ncbi:hypothetical protein SAMN06265364_12730 [Prevotella jejuni]|uniref:Uncharacterized protein n=1 Tax=Prevotella jejuni TaxID=1177574 RepID=A0AA94LL39_9BACT|nr:hypothetical protein SAMN06265364_12730 [Prevotella jejuni]